MTDQVNDSSTEAEASTTESAENTTESTGNTFNLSDHFSDDVKNDPDFERISANLPKDMASVAKDLYNKTKHFGKVKEDVRKEMEGEFNKTYKPEDYGYELPEDYQANEEVLGAVQAEAVKLGIKPEAFKALVEKFAGEEMASIAKLTESNDVEFNKQMDEEKAFLKEKNGIDSEAMLEKAKTEWTRFVDPRYKDTFQNFDKGTQLVLADMLNNIGSKVGEPHVGKQGGGSGMSPEGARVKILEIRNDKTIDSSDRAAQLAELYPIAESGKSAKDLGIVSNFSTLMA